MLDLLGPPRGLLLASVPHVLHLGVDTLLVDDTVLPVGALGGRKHLVTVELHVFSILVWSLIGLWCSW